MKKMVSVLAAIASLGLCNGCECRSNFGNKACRSVHLIIPLPKALPLHGDEGGKIFSRHLLHGRGFNMGTTEFRSFMTAKTAHLQRLGPGDRAIGMRTRIQSRRAAGETAHKENCRVVRFGGEGTGAILPRL
jgi:hypothetical protein